MGAARKYLSDNKKKLAELKDTDAGKFTALLQKVQQRYDFLIATGNVVDETQAAELAAVGVTISTDEKVRQLLRSLSEAPLQAYLDNRVQLFDIIEMILSETGPAEIYISTFSTSEEFLRRIYRLKRRGQLIRATMLADLKASRKTVNLYTFIANVFDEVYLSENHSKVILIQNARWQVSICTSQNQTRGNRVESGIITTDPAVFIQLRERYAHIINTNAIQLDGLFNGTT